MEIETGKGYNTIFDTVVHSSWHYSEKAAKVIVKDEMDYIQKSFKKKDTVADVAVEIGYGCG